MTVAVSAIMIAFI